MAIGGCQLTHITDFREAVSPSEAVLLSGSDPPSTDAKLSVAASGFDDSSISLYCSLDTCMACHDGIQHISQKNHAGIVNISANHMESP